MARDDPPDFEFALTTAWILLGDAIREMIGDLRPIDEH